MTVKSKKVLFLITKGSFGGAQRYVYDLARSITTERFNAAVAFGEGDVLGQKLDSLGIRVIRIPSLARDISVFKEIKSFFEIRRVLKIERPDILHINSSKGGLAALAARTAGVPKIIFTAHGWAFNEERGLLSKKIMKFLLWLTVIFSHTTIAVSEKERLDMVNEPFVKNKLKVIHNGVEIGPLENKSTLRHLLAPYIHEGVWIGTVSELHKNKGLDFVLTAFAKLSKRYSHIAFVIIGDGEERVRIGELIKKLELEDKVHMLGFVPNAEKVIGAFDIFTLTSRKEGLPYTILEAGAAEVAIVASKVGGIPEIITNKFNGNLVEAGNIEEIYHALQKLIDHPERRDLFGKRLGQRIRKRFSLREMIAKTVEVYES